MIVADRALEIALGAAREAGRLIRKRFRTPVSSGVKRSSSMVSEVDRAAEDLLRARLQARFPDHAVLGEEGGFTGGGDQDAPAWFIDPLDGTDNFLAGVPVFSVSLALLHGGHPLVAVIHDPVRGETFSATRGGGAFRGDEPLRCRADPLGRFSVLAVRHRFFRDGRSVLLSRLPTRKLRCLGSIALELALTAAGGFHACVAGGAHAWDVAAGALLVAEAGGAVLDLEGRDAFPLPEPPPRYAEQRVGIVAGAPEAARALQALIAAAPP